MANQGILNSTLQIEEFRNHPEDLCEKNGITYYLRRSASVNGNIYKRYAIQTHFVERGECGIDLIAKYVSPLYKSGDILSISEKVITMCQNHVVEKKDIKLGFWAKFLSKFASSNIYGVAMDEPYKLQLAINVTSLPRVLFASFCSAVTKLFGIHGVFYKIVGHGVSGIDGLYMDSAFALYRNIALLNPVEPAKVCNKIKNELGIDCMIVDANDLNVEILAKSESLSHMRDEDLMDMIRDNPAGQLDELTPFILIRAECS